MERIEWERARDGTALGARWAERPGIDKSVLLCDADRWQEEPLDDGEQALAAIAAWAPTEIWSDWADAAG